MVTLSCIDFKVKQQNDLTIVASFGSSPLPFLLANLHLFNCQNQAVLLIHPLKPLT